MGNLFTNHKADKNLYLNISNGGTDILFDVLLLSASKLANSNWEKCFATWIAGIDPDRILLGTIGFDIDDIGWTKENFDTEKSFVLKVVDEALNESGWNMLAYKPSQIKEKLEKFRILIETYEKSFIESEDWGDSSFFEGINEFSICPTHKIYKYKQQDGCKICKTIIYPN